MEEFVLMHASAQRLFTAAKEIKGIERPVDLAELMQIRLQVLQNWQDRGVSRAGALTAQDKIGCDARWILEGIGEMSLARPSAHQYAVSPQRYKQVFVVGRGEGGMPERIWTDGDYPVGATDEYADVATADPHAFLVAISGTSMSPRYQPGEFALVEPGTEPELEDDVLVRLTSGESMVKRLLSRRNGWRFGSYNDNVVLTFKTEDVQWVYYVAHPVPARKIKTRV